MFTGDQFALLSIGTGHIESQTHNYLVAENADYPEIPRISAYEAYVKYTQGKAFIIAGWNSRSRRHVLGSFNLDIPEEEKEKIAFEVTVKGILNFYIVILKFAGR